MAGSVLGTSLSSVSTEVSLSGSVVSTCLLSSILTCWRFPVTSSFATSSLSAARYNELKKKSI